MIKYWSRPLKPSADNMVRGTEQHKKDMERYKKDMANFRRGVKTCVAGAFGLSVTSDDNLLEGGYEFLENFISKEMNTIKNDRNRVFRENLRKCKWPKAVEGERVVHWQILTMGYCCLHCITTDIGSTIYQKGG